MSEKEIELIAEKILELTSKDNFIGYADTERFREISGISDYDFKEKVLHHPNFKKAKHQFSGSRKYYIHIETGLAALEKIFKGA